MFPAKIIIDNEVHCRLIGVHKDHMLSLYNEFGPFVPGYKFNPLFKLGRWDGRIRFVTEVGKTYVYLLDEIIPLLVKWRYDVEIIDNRDSIDIFPEPIDENVFSHINHPDTGSPIVLRDYQVELANALITNGNGLGLAATGAGKCQPLDCKVLTIDGWKTMGEIEVGDTVITPFSGTAKVIQTFDAGVKAEHEVVFEDGRRTRCCKDHLWVTNNYSKRVSTSYRILNTTELRWHLRAVKNSIPGKRGIASIPLLLEERGFPEQELPLDPQLFGIIISTIDLNATGIKLMLPNRQLVKYVNSVLENTPYKLQHYVNLYHHLRDKEVLPAQEYLDNMIPGLKKAVENISGAKEKTLIKSLIAKKASHPLLALHTLGLRKKGLRTTDKFIPKIYLHASRKQRIALLTGIVDTLAVYDTKYDQYKFNTYSKQFAEDVLELVRSLGGLGEIRFEESVRYKLSVRPNRHLYRYKYTLWFRYPNISEILTRTGKRRDIEFKQQHFRRNVLRVDHVRPTGRHVEMKCILLDDRDHLYVTDDYIITHNTLITAGIAKSFSDCDYRSLIIVPDTTLVAQTKADFELCQLDVGEFTGNRKDIDNQNIIATWQSLQNYAKLITTFDMVLVDEAHKAKSKVLQDILTNNAAGVPFRFGLTATLPRHDIDKRQIKCALGSTRYEIRAKRLIDEGVLAKLQISVKVLNEDFHAEYNTYCEKFIQNRLPGNKLTYSAFKKGYFPDYPAEKLYLERRTERIDYIVEMINERRSQKKGNILCLLNSITLARKLSKKVPGSYVVNSKDTKKVEERQEIYKKFAEEDDVVVFATVHIAGTGLSINRINHLLCVDVGKSFIRVLQAIGRGLRKAIDKKEVDVVDICSDLHYSSIHMRERIQFYKEEQYPHKIEQIQYRDN